MTELTACLPVLHRGLDSANAEIIADLLKQLAEAGFLIIASVNLLFLFVV